MNRIIIFGGTTEGRILAEKLSENNISSIYLVATEYGKQPVHESEYINIQSGRLDNKKMLELFKKEKPSVIVDATHPYAEIVKKEIKTALESYDKIPFYRIEREEDHISYKDCLFFDSAKECADSLEKTEGNIFLTTGSKELYAFCENENLRKRIIARVLPNEESIKICMDNGLNGKQIVAIQGPFSIEMNIAFLKEYNAKYLVLKESGKAGGEAERIEAAKKVNAKAYIIKRPQRESNSISLNEAINKICKICNNVLKN
ncbi:MAG: precorrin-6A reductase [Butyrivibrio sp.]|nr:precorrin-6A reductase [Butyrivibrio sp.]